MKQLAVRSKKVLVGLTGGLVVLIGLIMVPYPGPGWLVVFGGLAILATEFEFAARLLTYTRGKYDAWANWLKRQNWFIKIAVLGFTGVIVLLTLWLLNAFGIVIALFDIPYTQFESPLFK